MHAIMRDSIVYTWNSLSPQGTKITFPTGADPTRVDALPWARQLSDGSDASACKAWLADESKFALPAGVMF
jgi:hypothetical protein